MLRLPEVQDTWSCPVFPACGSICSTRGYRAYRIPIASGSLVSFPFPHKCCPSGHGISVQVWVSGSQATSLSLYLGVLAPMKRMASSLCSSVLYSGTLLIPPLGSPSLVFSYPLGLTSGAINLV